jgi:hypothetical protein
MKIRVEALWEPICKYNVHMLGCMIFTFDCHTFFAIYAQVLLQLLVE